MVASVARVREPQVALGKGSFFAEWLPVWHSTKGAPLGPFASPFAEHAGRHSAKGAFLPSARTTTLGKGTDKYLILFRENCHALCVEILAGLHKSFMISCECWLGFYTQCVINFTKRSQIFIRVYIWYHDISTSFMILYLCVLYIFKTTGSQVRNHVSWEWCSKILVCFWNRP
jgi:hypothetical protein